MKKIIFALVLFTSLAFTAVAETKATHEEHKEQIVVMFKSLDVDFNNMKKGKVTGNEVKIPEGWHVVCMTVGEKGNLYCVLEKN